MDRELIAIPCENFQDLVRKFWEKNASRAGVDDKNYDKLILDRLNCDLDLLEFYCKNESSTREAPEMEESLFKSIANTIQSHSELIEYRSDLIQRAALIALEIVGENLGKILDETQASGERIQVDSWKWVQIGCSLQYILDNLVEFIKEPNILKTVEAELLRILKHAKKVNPNRVPDNVVAASARCLARLFSPIVPLDHLYGPLEEIVFETLIPVARKFSCLERFISEEAYLCQTIFVKPTIPVVCDSPWWTRKTTSRMLEGYTNSASRSLRATIIYLTRLAWTQQKSSPIVSRLLSNIEQYDIDPLLAELALDVTWTLDCSCGMTNLSEEYVEKHVVRMILAPNIYLKCRLFEFFRQWIRRLTPTTIIDKSNVFEPIIEHAIETFLNDETVSSVCALFCLVSFVDKQEESVVRIVSRMKKLDAFIAKLFTSIYPNAGILDDFKLFQMLAPIISELKCPKFSDMKFSQEFIIAAARRLELALKNEVTCHGEVLDRVAEFIVILSGSFEPKDLIVLSSTGSIKYLDTLIERMSQTVSNSTIVELSPIQRRNFCISLMICSPDNPIAWDCFKTLCGFLREDLQIFHYLNRFGKTSCRAAFNAMVVVVDTDPRDFFESSDKISTVLDDCRVGLAIKDFDLNGCIGRLINLLQAKWPPSSGASLSKHLREFNELAVGQKQKPNKT